MRFVLQGGVLTVFAGFVKEAAIFIVAYLSPQIG
jgi:hypothetical protein